MLVFDREGFLKKGRRIYCSPARWEGGEMYFFLISDLDGRLSLFGALFGTLSKGASQRVSIFF